MPDAFTAYDFAINWAQERVVCPNGKTSMFWKCYHQKCYHQGGRYPSDLVKVRFATADCRACPLRARCTRSPGQAKSLNLQPGAAFEALKAARAYMLRLKGARLTDSGRASRAPCLKA